MNLSRSPLKFNYKIDGFYILFQFLCISVFLSENIQKQKI